VSQVEAEQAETIIARLGLGLIDIETKLADPDNLPLLAH